MTTLPTSTASSSSVAERSIEHRGCRIAYAVRGNGPAVLLIQGVGVWGDGWRPQIDELASRYTCISFDNRGLARSQPTGVTVSVELMAEDALAVFDAAGIATAHIVGHSLGGLIAVQIGLGELAGLPTLTVSAGFDPVAPPRAGQALRDGIPGSRYVEVSEASHGMPITHAKLVNALFLDHLSAADAA